MKIDSPVSPFSSNWSTSSLSDEPVSRQPDSTPWTSSVTDGFDAAASGSPLSSGFDSFGSSSRFGSFGSSRFDAFGSFSAGSRLGSDVFGASSMESDRMAARLVKAVAVSALFDAGGFGDFAGASGSLHPMLALHAKSGGGNKPMLPPPGSWL